MTTFRVHDLTLRSRPSGDDGRLDAYYLAIAHALDAAGVDVVEVASPNGGLDAATLRWCETVAAGLDRARLAITLSPDGLEVADARRLLRHGVGVVRVLAAPQAMPEACRAVGAMRRSGFEVDAVLPWSGCDAARLAARASGLGEAGAHSVTIADMRGRLLPAAAAEIFATLAESLPAGTTPGIEAHPSLQLGVANTVIAADHGARRLCGTLRGVGRGVGAVPLEMLVAAVGRLGHRPRACVFDLIDIAEDFARPLGRLLGGRPFAIRPAGGKRPPAYAAASRGAAAVRPVSALRPAGRRGEPPPPCRDGRDPTAPTGGAYRS